MDFTATSMHPAQKWRDIDWGVLPILAASESNCLATRQMAFENNI